jgi:hypothetical protein
VKTISYTNKAKVSHVWRILFVGTIESDLRRFEWKKYKDFSSQIIYSLLMMFIHLCKRFWKTVEKKLMIEHCIPGILEISENETSNLRSKDWKSNYAIVFSVAERERNCAAKDL